jgi:starch synthase
MRVLFVTSECAPFAKTGGLGEVIGALPTALRRHGLDVRVVMPLYAGMPWQRFEPLEGVLSVPMWFGTAHARVRLGRLPHGDVPVYFLEPTATSTARTSTAPHPTRTPTTSSASPSCRGARSSL